MALYLNPQGVPVWHGVALELPPKEKAVLALLMLRHPRAVSKEEIIEHAWIGGHSVSDDSVARCISTLRRLLPDVRIESVYGFGYRLSSSEVVVHTPMMQVASGPPHVVETYMHAMGVASQRTPVAMVRGMDVIRELVDAYPDYMPARLALAHLSAVAIALGMSEEVRASTEEAWVHLDAVSHSQPNAAGLTATRALLAAIEWRFDEAEILYRRLVENGPISAEILHPYAWHLIATARTDEAVAALRSALDQRRHAAYTRVVFARALAYVERYEDALQEIAFAEREHPGDVVVASARVTIQASFQPSKSLVKAARRLSAVTEVPPYARVCLPFVLARCGQTGEARRELEQVFESPGLTVSCKVLHGTALAALGELDRGAAVIEEAYRVRYGWLPFVLRSPLYAPLLQHPVVGEVFRTVFSRVQKIPLPGDASVSAWPSGYR